MTQNLVYYWTTREKMARSSALDFRVAANSGPEAASEEWQKSLGTAETSTW